MRTWGSLPLEEVSPMQFVAIAEKMTMAERLASMLADVGLIHAGVVYVVTPSLGQSEATRVEREAAQLRLRAGAPRVMS